MTQGIILLFPREFVYNMCKYAERVISVLQAVYSASKCSGFRAQWQILNAQISLFSSQDFVYRTITKYCKSELSHDNQTHTSIQDSAPDS